MSSVRYLRPCRTWWALVALAAAFPSAASAQTDCLVQTQIPVTECQALLAIYNGLGGPNWTAHHTDWNTDNLPCGWSGIACDAGQVVELALNSFQLTGPIPPELEGLPALRSLLLAGGDVHLTGPIPPEIGTLTGLEFLVIGRVRDGGTIPPEIAQLTQLTFLSLSGCELTGTIPSSIGELNQLVELYLSFNQLTGPIPSSIGNLGCHRPPQSGHPCSP